MDVNEFMQKLSEQTASTSKKEFKKTSKALEKISLNYMGNYGRYQILPMNSVIEDYPFITLFNTREICIPRKSVGADGQVSEYTAWIKILPHNGYKMKDLTGRCVSSLTAEDESLLESASTLFDQLYTEIDARNNVDIARNLIRKRNYTVFNGYCLNRWDFENTRTPVRQNFSGLFVCTAKGFTQAVESNLQERALMNGNDYGFVNSIYNRLTTGRTGFMMFSISQNKNQAGYSVSVSHEWDKAQMLQGVVIPEEDAELMKDPVEQFLGWQANRDNENPVGSKRLFNAPLIKEAISFMTQMLAAVRMAKSSGGNIANAIEETNKIARANAVAQEFKKTNDPMLKEEQGMAAETATPDFSNNNSPFQTPPAARIDPMSGTPAQSTATPFGGQQNMGGSPFQAPSFSSPFGGGQQSGDGLPF